MKNGLLLIKLNGIIKDTYKVVKGFFTILRHSMFKDKISLDFSFFSTPSSVVRPGSNCTYDIGICNTSDKNTWVKLLIDIYLMENPVHPEGHYGFFDKTIYIKANQSQLSRISYDWANSVLIEIDNLNFNPENFSREACQIKGKYLVKALLLDQKGKAFSELSLVQNLSE